MWKNKEGPKVEYNKDMIQRVNINKVGTGGRNETNGTEGHP